MLSFCPFRGPKCGIFRHKIFLVFLILRLLIVGGSEQPTHLTPMDKHNFVLPYLHTDQCMPQQGQHSVGSFGMLFRLPHGYLCPGDGLVICYLSQLDSHKTANGVAAARQYQVHNQNAKIVEKCCQANPEECDNLHGIQVATNAKGNIVVELSIASGEKYLLPMVDQFWIDFGQMDNLKTAIRIPDGQGKKSRKSHRFPTDQARYKAFMENVGKGATMQQFAGLWLLGVDILPIEPVNQLQFFVHRDCECTLQAWFIHPTSNEEPSGNFPLEVGSNECKAENKEMEKHFDVGSLEMDDKIKIWLLSKEGTKSVQIELFVDGHMEPILTMTITKERITYNETNWDYATIELSSKGETLLGEGRKIYVEIYLSEYFFKVDYVEEGKNKMTNHFWSSEMKSEYGKCEILVKTDAFMGTVEKGKTGHKDLDPMPPLPYSLKLSAAFEHKSKILIHGQVHPNAKFFSINLMHDAPEWHEYIGATPLRIHINFTANEMTMDTYNSDKKWHGNVKRTLDKVPFKRGQTFNCLIEAERFYGPVEKPIDQQFDPYQFDVAKVLYTISVNGNWETKYGGDLPIWTINWLWFTGDMDLLVEPVVEYTTKKNGIVVKQELGHLFNFEEALCISGFIKSFSESNPVIKFQINLFHEANEFNNRIGDTILRLYFVFNRDSDHEGTQLVIQDYLHELGKWGEENKGPNLIGQTGQDFSVAIVAKKGIYEIFINGGVVPRNFTPTNYEQPYGVPAPPWGTNWLTVSGDVENIKIGSDSGHKDCLKYGGQKLLPSNIKEVNPNLPLKIGDSILIQGIVKKGQSNGNIAAGGLRIFINFFREALDFHPIMGQTVMRADILMGYVQLDTYYSKKWQYEANGEIQVHKMANPLAEDEQFLMKVEVKKEGYEIQIGTNKFTYPHKWMPFWAVQYITVEGDLQGPANVDEFIQIQIA